MNLNRRSMVTILSVIALVLIGASAYFLRDRFSASQNTELGAKSFNIKVVDADGAGVKDAEVAIVFAPTGDTNAKTYFLDPTNADALKTQQFSTGLTTDEIAEIKANPLSALKNSVYNSKITNPFDESQSFEDWGMAWYAHHTGGNAGCTIEPCFSNLTVIKFTNKEDKTTDENGNLVFKLSYLDKMLNKMVNNNWTAIRVYVHYNGKTTAQNLSDGTFAPNILAKAQSGADNTITIKLPSTDLATVADGDAGISVLVKNLQDQPVQGATVKLTLQCYKNGSEVYNSNTEDSAPLTLTSGADGIAKLTALGWEDAIVKKLGSANTNGCPKDKAATEDNQPEGKLTKSLSIRAYYGEERTAPFVFHGPYSFAYNGSYADFFYVNTSADATGFADPLGTGDTRVAPVFTKSLTNTHPVTDGKMAYGDHATLEWSATGTTRCKIEGEVFGASGSWVSPAVTTDKEYSVICYNGSLQTTSTVSVAVGPNPETITTVGTGVKVNWYNNSVDGTFPADKHVGLVDIVSPTIVLNPPAVTEQDNMSAKFEGFIMPPSSGKYTFKVTVDDGAKLIIDGLNILPAAAWGNHSTSYLSSEIYLDKNISHSIRVDYYNGPGARKLWIEWSGPGLTGSGYEEVAAKYLFVTNPYLAAEAATCDSNSWAKDGAGIVTIPADCENKSIIIKNVTVNGEANVTNADGKRHFDNVLITEGAIVTHSAVAAGEDKASTKKIDWVLTGNLTINGNSKIDVTGKGYPGGIAGAGTVCTPNTVDLTLIDGKGLGGGKGAKRGSATYYAGSGANAGNGGTNGASSLGGVAYQTNISQVWSSFDFGSGGGAAEGTGLGCFNGGAGGGRVRIVSNGDILVESVPVTSTNAVSKFSYILANGEPSKPIAGDNDAYRNVLGGAGAGGTILLQARNTYATGNPGPSANAGNSLDPLYKGTNGVTAGSMSQALQANGGSVSNRTISTGSDSDGNSISDYQFPGGTSGGGGVVAIKSK